MSIADLILAAVQDEYIVPKLNEFLTDNQGQPQFRAKGLHPSEVAGKCARQVILKQVLEIPKTPPDIVLQRIFDDGTMHHTWYQERYLGPAGVLYGEWVCSRCKAVHTGFMPQESCSCQQHPDDRLDLVPTFCWKKCGQDGNPDKSLPYWWRQASKVSERGGCVHCGQMNESAWGAWHYREPRILIPELGIVGHSDGLVQVDGKWYVLEIKTINTNGFRYLKEVSPRYRAQAAVYMHAFLHHMGSPFDQVEGVLFLYVNKNGAITRDGKIRKEVEFLEKWDDVCERTMAGIRSMKKSLDDRTLPEMQLTCSATKRTRGCDMWEHCSLLPSGKSGWAEAVELRDRLKDGVEETDECEEQNSLFEF